MPPEVAPACPVSACPSVFQTFREIRAGGYCYLDKTGFAVRLFEQGKAFFLSRPRRFGKSLFLDPLAELFSGNPELFKGLYAERHWDFSQHHPVVRLSFGGGVIEARTGLDQRIPTLLYHNQQQLGVCCREPDNIAVDAGYSASCGYTEADLDQAFAPELVGLDLEQIRA